MRSSIILFIIISLLFPGCAARVNSFMNKDSNSNIARMSGNRLAGGLTTVELNAQRFDKGGNLSYSLIIIYSSPTFINIGSGKTLILIIDGQRLEIPGRGSENYRSLVSIGLIEEKAYYHDVDPELIRRLAYAKEVEVEIIGTSKIVNRHFKEKNFINFREFYDLYVNRHTGS